MEVARREEEKRTLAGDDGEVVEGDLEGELGTKGVGRRQFLVIYNISKRNNIKDLCWTAGAHCFEVLYVSASNMEGNHFYLNQLPTLSIRPPPSAPDQPGT
jgi:hypothetical protein